MIGRPWDKKGMYDTFEEADEIRHLYLDVSEETQAKVHRTADGKFLVKTRTHPDFEPKKEKKKMGKIADEIRRIQVEECLTLPQIFEKYPHLATLQHKELMEEHAEPLSERKKQLLCD